MGRGDGDVGSHSYTIAVIPVLLPIRALDRIIHGLPRCVPCVPCGLCGVAAYGITIERSDAPSFITANAFSISSSGNRCVTCRLMSTIPWATILTSGL